MPIEIIPLSEPHFAALHRCLDIVAREKRYLAFTQAPPIEQSIAFYRNILASDLVQFTALQGGEVVGWCDILPQIGQARAHVGTLGIALVPAARHRGIGALLLRAAIDKAWTKGLTRIELRVRTDNANAKALYERFGFAVEGTQKRAIRIDVTYFDSIAMALLR